ncbi:MAG TPA: FAD:protein FMN transferase [Thermoanaerobaculia bacterium]
MPAIPLAIALGLAAASPRTLVERRVASMGTSLDVAIVAPTRDAGLDASEIVVAEARRVEDLLTTWRDSPLARLNAAPPGVDVPVGQEIVHVLTEVFEWARRTGRAFDPTVAPLLRAWDLRGVGRIPAASELIAAVAATGPEHFHISLKPGSVARLDPSAAIDEGAWGKGYALDRAGQRLAAAGVADALIDLGGQALALGRDASGDAWRIGVADPRDRERPVVLLSLTDVSSSTSANSERRRTVNGRRIGHELDPRTGEPAPDFGSATVVAPSGLVADVLSTAFFVLGPVEGLALSGRLRAEGVPQEVLFLIERDGGLEAVASPGFSRYVVSADPNLPGLPFPSTP